MSTPMIYSAGPCPVCSDMGGVFFVKASTGKVFCFCPHCAVAWDNPPTPSTLDSVDSLEKYASGGILLATQVDIAKAGMSDLVRQEFPSEEWEAFFEGYLLKSDG